MSRMRAAVIGAGYFSHFHYDAWARIADVDVVACCDIDERKANEVAKKFGIANVYGDYLKMLDDCQIDFVDIVTRPDTHLPFGRTIAERSLAMICQKPLAPTFKESRELVKIADAAGVRFMVHENFRFQPWYREIKRLLDAETIGNKLHTITFRNRAGDGWGDDAYLRATALLSNDGAVPDSRSGYPHHRYVSVLGRRSPPSMVPAAKIESRDRGRGHGIGGDGV